MKGAPANPLRGCIVCTFTSRPHLPGDPREPGGAGLSLPQNKQSAFREGERDEKEERPSRARAGAGRGDAALPGMGLTYGGGGQSCWGLWESPGMRWEQGGHGESLVPPGRRAVLASWAQRNPSTVET